MNLLNSKLLLMSLFLTACGSLDKKINHNIELSQLESISIGSSRENVKNILGSPDKSYLLAEKSVPDQILWIYPTKEGFSRVSVTFDSKNQTVISKVFSPIETENESQLKFLLKDKFKDLSFKEIPAKMCLHILPHYSNFVNFEKGIGIRYDTKDRVVESISWLSPESLRESMRQRQESSKRDYKMSESSKN